MSLKRPKTKNGEKNATNVKASYFLQNTISPRVQKCNDMNCIISLPQWRFAPLVEPDPIWPSLCFETCRDVWCTDGTFVPLLGAPRRISSSSVPTRVPPCEIPQIFPTFNDTMWLWLSRTSVVDKEWQRVIHGPDLFTSYNSNLDSNSGNWRQGTYYQFATQRPVFSEITPELGIQQIYFDTTGVGFQWRSM